jgi:hypothetical protein
MYTGYISVGEDNVYDTFTGCYFLQMIDGSDKLLDYCTNFMIRQLETAEVASFIKIWSHADQFQVSKLKVLGDC